MTEEYSAPPRLAEFCQAMLKEIRGPRRETPPSWELTDEFTPNLDFAICRNYKRFLESIGLYGTACYRSRQLLGDLFEAEGLDRYYPFNLDSEDMGKQCLRRGFYSNERRVKWLEDHSKDA